VVDDYKNWFVYINFMKFLNLLTDEIKVFDEIISSKLKSFDFIVSVPHWSSYLPVDIFEYRNWDKSILIDTDLWTDLLFDFSDQAGFFVKGFCNTYFLNYSRDSNNLGKNGVFPWEFLDGTDLKKNVIPTSLKTELISKFYVPYHLALKNSISQMLKAKGFALVLDGHSMNSVGLKSAPDFGKKRADLVIGTRDGTSCSSEVEKVFFKSLSKGANKLGLAVALNDPYKGGFITQKYGDPKNNIHCIQLEVVKKNYMVEVLSREQIDSDSFKPDFAKIEQLKKVIFNALLETSKYLERNVKTLVE
jgi:N-formylglutamate amidohydrolase